MKAKKRIYLDFHMPEHGTQAPPGVPVAYQQLDPSELAAQVSRSGAEVLVFYALDNQGNSYYPTDIGHHLRDLNGRDIVQEFLDALRPRNVRAVAYFQPIRNRRLWEDHPSWRQINSDGTEKVPQSWLQEHRGGHRLICPIGEASSRILAELRELVTLYDLDGVWWDRVGDIFGPDHQFPCFCTTCREEFRSQSGFDIPTCVDWESSSWRTFYQWRSDALLRFQKAAHETVRDYGRGACLISNYAFHGMVMADPIPLSVDWEAIANATDVFALEVQHMRSYFHVTSHPMLASALTDKPCEMIMWNNGHIGDGFVRSAPHAEVTALTSYARGHAVTFHDTIDHIGRADPRLFEIASRVFSKLDLISEDVESGQVLKYLGVLFSPMAYTWHGKGKPAGYVQEFLGMLRQAVGCHVPVEAISDRHLVQRILQSYKMLVLPMSACIGESASKNIRQWVEDGGVVFGTHEVGTRNAEGATCESAFLADLFGVRFKSTSEISAGWMKQRSDTTVDLGWGKYPVAFRSSYVSVEPFPDTEIIAEIGIPLPGLDTFAHFIAPPQRWGPDPALTRRALGKGYAYYCSPSLGATDLGVGLAALRGPLQAAILDAESPVVRLTAPECVEMIVRTCTDDSLLVHLMNLQGEVSRTHRMASLPDRTQGHAKILPVVDIVIAVRHVVQMAHEVFSGVALPIESFGRGQSRIVLPRLDAAATIKLKLTRLACE